MSDADDTARTELPDDDEARELERIARKVAQEVFRTAVIRALPAIRVQAYPATHGYIEGQRYEFRCFESTVIDAQLFQVTDADLVCRTLVGTHIVIPRRSVIVAHLLEHRR